MPAIFLPSSSRGTAAEEVVQPQHSLQPGLRCVGQPSPIAFGIRSGAVVGRETRRCGPATAVIVPRGLSCVFCSAVTRRDHPDRRVLVLPGALRSAPSVHRSQDAILTNQDRLSNKHSGN